MTTRRASIKETGEELSQAEWARFDAAVARLKAERAAAEPRQGELHLPEAAPERRHVDAEAARQA